MSDTAIGLMIGCHRDTARAARRRNGVPALGRGRARGTRTRPSTVRFNRTAGELIAERIVEQSSPVHGPSGSSRQMLASRVAALNAAYGTGDSRDIRAALIELAAGCGLVHDQLDRLEAA